MSDRAGDMNIAARHVAFAEAVRARDPLAAARAASRLRIPGAFLTARELMAGRRARAAVGRALVRARMTEGERRRMAAFDEVVPQTVAPRVLRRRAFPLWRTLAAAAAIVLLAVLFRPGGGFFGGGSTEQDKPAGVNVLANATLRGRSVGLASQVVATATPQPTTTPPVAVPGTSASPNPIGGAGGGSPVPGGAGGFGSPGPGGTPPVPALGFGRITVTVVDAQTNQPLRNVCVIMGSQSCVGLTDQQGKWSADIKLPAPRVPFDMNFTVQAYNPGFRQIELVQGQEVTARIALTRP